MSLPGNLRLPFDILLELIHSLDPNHDNGTLRSLSATCHTLCAPSQSRLFSSITIRENTRTHEHVFHGHILKSPHLASYIRYLDYRCIYVNYHWVAKILDLLPVNNIEVLKISTENRNGYEYIGYELPDALVRIVQSPRLRQLQLHGLTSIPWFATNAPNLTDLLLDISSFQLPGQDAQTGILGVKSLTMTGRSLERSSQLKLALRCSPLLRNLRFYGEYSAPIIGSRIAMTYIVLRSSSRGCFYQPCNRNYRGKPKLSVHTGDLRQDETLLEHQCTSLSSPA